MLVITNRSGWLLELLMELISRSIALELMSSQRETIRQQEAHGVSGVCGALCTLERCVHMGPLGCAVLCTLEMGGT